MQTMDLFARNATFPSWWANALGRFLSALANNLVLAQTDATHIQVAAGVNELAAIVAIGGKWRYLEAPITRAHPGGAAGTYPLFVTTADNEIVNTPDPFTDTTNYAFDFAIMAPGATPTIVAGTVDFYRQIGTCEWSGSAITRIDQTVPRTSLHKHSHMIGQPDAIAPADIGAATTAALNAEIARATAAEPTAGEVAALAGTGGVPSAGNPYVTQATLAAGAGLQPGDLVTSAAATRAGCLLCDGSAQSRTAFAALFAAIGTAYGVGDGSTTFNLPDYRGRTIVGAGTGAGLTTRVRGISDGEQSHLLVAGELAGHHHRNQSQTTGNELEDHTHYINAISGSGASAGFIETVGASLGITATSGISGHHQHTLPAFDTDDSGGGAAHNNMQPYTVANVFIKT